MKINNDLSNDQKAMNFNVEKKRRVKKIEKSYIKLTTLERANLKQLSRRKFISVKAIKQILALILFDKGRTMTVVMEELALSPQTLLGWRKDFKEKRMDSLIVFFKKRRHKDDREDDVNDNDDIGNNELDSSI